VPCSTIRPKRHAEDRPIVTGMAERWLAEIGGQCTKQTAHQHRAAVAELVAWLPERAGIQVLDRRKAGAFVSTKLLTSGRTQKTVNRIIASLSSMWRWLVKRGFVEANPWQGQGTFTARAKRSEGRKRAYTSGELVPLLAADPCRIVGQRYGAVIADLLRLGLLTGCRPNELCELRVEDVLVEQQAFQVREGKTENARRLMPVHQLAWPILVRRLAAGSKDSWLFSGLTPGGPDGKRSWFVSKRFTTFRRAVLGSDDTVDFHSLRRTFAAYLERASTLTTAVNVSTIAELMGHEKQTLALAVYSSGLVPQQLRAAIDSLDLVLEPEISAAAMISQGR
jgi:integrase